MPRLMSVAFTEQAVRDRTKTVTRRKGWRDLKAGTRLTLCRKVMGRRQGEPLVRIVDVEVVSVRREILKTITPEDVAREGFPGMHPLDFVHRFFVEAQGMQADDEVTRIEWRYLDSVSPEDRREIAADVHRERTQDAATRYQEHPGGNQ